MEGYVSFEIAKLLKEHGFDDIIYPCYKVLTGKAYGSSNGKPIFSMNYDNSPCPCLVTNSGYDKFANHDDKFYISAPTLDEAVKWLRRKHHIVVSIYPAVTDDDGEAGCLWEYSISKHCVPIHVSGMLFDKCDDALSKAIEYSLRQVIL